MSATSGNCCMSVNNELANYMNTLIVIPVTTIGVGAFSLSPTLIIAIIFIITRILLIVITIIIATIIIVTAHFAQMY